MIDTEEIIITQLYSQALGVALLHRRATMVGFKQDKTFSQDRQCPCCRKIIRKTLPVNFKMKDIEFLGQGYTLYFSFTIMCLVLCVILFAIQKISTLMNQTQYFSSIYTYEIKTTIVVVASIAVFYFFEKKMKEISLVRDQEQIDPEDYTVWIRNLPIQFQKDKQMEKQIEQYFQKMYEIPVKVASICFCYNLVPLIKFTNRKKGQLKQLKIHQSVIQKKRRVTQAIFDEDYQFEQFTEYHGVKTSFDKQIQMANFYDNVKSQIESINELISYSYHQSKVMFIGQVFVSFQTVQMRDIVLKYSNNTYFYGNKLVIQNAPNPRNVFWDNLHLDNSNIIRRKLFSWISCVAIIFMMLAIKISSSWIGVFTKNTILQSSILKSSSSTLIVMTNIIIQDVLMKQITRFEGHRTKISYLTTFALKCICLQFSTCLVVPFLSADVILNVKQQQTYFDRMDSVINKGVVIALFLIAISHRTLIKKITIKLYEIGGWRFIPKKLLTIKELAKLYELPEFQIQKRYSQTIKNTLLAFCFGAIIPKSIVYVIVYLVFSYHIDKYNLVRRRIANTVLNDKMNKTLLKIIHLTLPLYIISTMIINRKITPLMTILLIVSFLASKILEKIQIRQKHRQKASEFQYWQANAKYFYTDYKRQNPALQGISKIQYDNKMKQLNLK